MEYYSEADLGLQQQPKPLTIITKCSILDLVAVLDPFLLLNCFYYFYKSFYCLKWNILLTGVVYLTIDTYGCFFSIKQQLLFWQTKHGSNNQYLKDKKKQDKKSQLLSFYCNKEGKAKDNQIVKIVASQSFSKTEVLRLEMHLQNSKINIHMNIY